MSNTTNQHTNPLNPIWQPTAQRIAESKLNAFINQLNETEQLDIQNYQQLHRWSVSDANAFWQAVWQFCHVIGSTSDTVSRAGDAKYGEWVAARDTEWFPDTTLNYAQNLLRFAVSQPTEPAIIFENEQGDSVSIDWLTLTEQVKRVQYWLKENGVQKGDVVAGYLPHSAQAVVAMLAATSLGAVWTSTSPDFGVDSVIERFDQVAPKVLFCCNGYQFGGKAFPMMDKNLAIIEGIASITAGCVIDYLGQEQTLNDNLHRWQYIADTPVHGRLKFEPVAFDHPLFILYSSGTTGKPKCIVHSTGGTLLNHLKEHQLHCDVQRHDRVFYYTTCGWMMWNWHVSALASGATLVIYDGHPLKPQEVLWSLAERHKVTLFGTAAKYLESLDKQGFSPSESYDLTALKTLCSTGSILYPAQFDYVYKSVKQDIHLASISGGTDICGCFVLGDPISPLYRGDCQSLGLGLDVDVVDDQAQSIVGQRGELVCRNSFPNQPVGFWNDDGSKYHNAYWNKYQGIWHHGDDVQLTEQQGMRFFGRSDAILNPGGIRIGTAEIYRQVNTIEGIEDCMAVGREIENDQVIVLFVKLSQAHALTEVLIAAIKEKLKTRCSPRHVPAEIHAISDIPRTKSGKIVEVAARNIVNGKSVDNEGAIANPSVLDEIRERFSV